jgi:uncharacterized membrane protein YdjX (TVP38/TMEM64 family)
MGLRAKILAAAALGSVVLLAKTFAPKEEFDAWWSSLLEIAEGESGPRGVMIVVALYFFGAILGMPPTPLEFFTGYKYGLTAGFAITVAGKQTGGMVAYWLGRTVFREFFRKNVMPTMKILRALDGAFKEDGLKMAFVFRSMFIPTPVKNYGCAALGCKFWHATAASMVFGPLYGAANLYAGSAARAVRDVGGGGADVNYVKQAVKVLTGGLFVLASIAAMSIMKKHLAKLTEEVEAKAAAAEAQEQQARREREPRAKLPASPRATRTTRRSASPTTRKRTSKTSPA